MAYSNYGGIQDQIRRKREEEERRKRHERERLQAIAARQAGQKLMEEQRRKKEADTKGKKKAEPANKKKEQGKPASSVLDKKDEAEKKKSPETQIKAPPVATGPRNIKWGSRGEDVKEMQSGLVKQGYDIGPFGPLKDGIDGIVGRFTNKGIRDFQRDHGLQVDGIFGPESRAKLEEVLLDSSMDKEYAHIDLSKYGYDASKVSPEDQNMLRRAIGMQQKYGSVEMGELVEKKGAKAILDEQEANKGKYEALAEEKLQLEGLLDEQRLGLTGYYDPKTGSFMSGSADPDMPAGYWDQEGNYIPTGYQSKENRRQLQNYYAMQGTERRLRQIAAEMAALGGTDTEGVDPTSYDTRKLDDAYAKQQLDFRKAEPALWEDYTKGLEPVEDETGEGAAEPQVTARGIHPLDINMGRLAAGDRAYIKELEQAQRPPVDTGNPSFDEALVNGFRGKTIDASKIPNKATFARDNIDDIRFATYMSGQKINKQGSSLQDYTYMTDEEVDTYTALLNAEGVERADAYFASLSDRIAQRKGEHQAGVFSELSAELPGVGVPLQLGTTVLGAAAKNVQNLGRAFGGDIFPTDTEYTLSGITSDLAQKGPTVNIPGVGPMKLGAVAADIAYNTGNMLPSILVNSFLPGVGAVEMGVSAGASEYAEQFLSGNMTQSQARAMGLMSGTVETIMEKLLGLPMAGGGKLLGNFTSMGGGIANPILRRLGQVGIESLGEFAEEYTTENLNKWMEKLAKGEQLRPDDWQWTSPEAIYSGLMGLITGAMFSGGQAVKTGLDSRSVGRDVKAGMLDYTQGDLVDFGMGQDSGSRAYRLAQQIAEAGGEASPMALGDLFFEAAGAGYEVQTETEPTRYEEETGMQAEAMEDTYTEPQQAVDEDVRYTVDEMPDELAPVEETIGREPIPARQEVTARDAGRVAAEATVPTPEQIAEAETATEAEGDADWFDDWQTKMRRAALEAAAEQEARKATQTGQGAAAEARTGAEALAHLAASEAPVQARQSIPEATQARVQAIEDKNVRRLFDQGVQAANDATRYADSFVRLHDSALSGITFEQAQESAPAMIEAVGDTTARLIFEYGNLENRQRIARRENLKAEALSEARRVKDEAERVERETPVPLARFEAEGQDQGPGVYYDTGVKEAGVTAETRRQLDILDGMADRYGVRIVVTDKLPGDVNGMYDPDQGDVIYISADATDGALAAFAQHELTHYLQESSPEDYGLLRDTVVDALRDGGMDIEARVKYFTDRGLTEDAAIDEIVANGMMSTLSDPDTVTRIVETSPSLAQRIRAWLNDLINSITESISRLGKRTGQSEVAFMEQNRAQLQQVFDMFDDALERTRDQRAGQAALEAQAEADVGTEAETDTAAQAETETTTAPPARAIGRKPKSIRKISPASDQAKEVALRRVVKRDGGENPPALLSNGQVLAQNGDNALYKVNALYYGVRNGLEKSADADKTAEAAFPNAKPWELNAKEKQMPSAKVLKEARKQGLDEWTLTAATSSGQAIDVHFNIDDMIDAMTMLPNTESWLVFPDDGKTPVLRLSMLTPSLRSKKANQEALLKPVRTSASGAEPNKSLEFEKRNGMKDGNPAVRYSMKDEGDAGYSRDLSPSDVIADEDYTASAEKLVDGMLRAANKTAKRLGKAKMNEIASKVAKNYIKRNGSTMDEGELANDLFNTLDMTTELQGEDSRQLGLQIASEIGLKIYDTTEVKIEDGRDLSIQEAAAHIRSVQVSIPPGMGEFYTDGGNFENFNELRKKYGIFRWKKGTVDKYGRTYDMDGMKPDELYAELRDAYPHLFPEELLSVEEATSAILDALDMAMNPSTETYSPALGASIEERFANAIELGADILADLYEEIVGVSGKNADVERLKADFRAQTERMKQQHEADTEAAVAAKEAEYKQKLADLEKEDRETITRISKDYRDATKEAKELAQQMKETEAAHETLRARLSKDIRGAEERLSKAQTKLAEARATVRETQKALEAEQKARAKDAEKIAKLKGDLDTANRALKDAEKRFKAETDALVKASQRANAEMQKQLKKAADLREHAARLEERRIAREIKSKALKEKYQTLTSRHRKAELERKAKAKEKTKASVMRTRVTKSAMELRKWLAQPTDQNHVPAFMQQAVAGALDLIDMMGRTPEKGPNKGITRTTKRGRGWRESIRVLKESIEQVVNNNSALNDRYQDIVDRLDPDLLPNLEDLVKSLTRDAATGAKHNLSDLSSSQLAQLDKILKGIRAISRNATKIYRNAQFNDIRDLGNATIAEVGKKKQRTRHGLISRFLRWDQADSFTAFAAMGKSAETVQAGLFKGQEQAFKRVRSAQEFISQLRRDLGVSKSAIRNWSEQARTVTLESGAKRVMTVGQMMELYNLWQRTDTENARNHIMKGGIKLPPAKEGLGRTRAQRAIKLTEGDMDIIIGQLTDTQRRFADEMRQYLSTEVSSWGNETSMELYLYEKFTENNYWPIKSSREVLSTKGDESNMMFNALKNMGFTKSLQTGANNTIDIGDAMQTFTDHVSQMAVYNGMAAPMQDALSWLNYRQYDENGNRVTSLKQELGMVFGPEAERYVKNFFRNVNGMSTGDFGTEIANKALGRFRASAVAGSFRVMIQQPTAIVRAMSMINPRHFVATKFGRRTVAEMERWAPIAWWKMNGGYEVGLGHSMRETIIGDASVLDSAKTKMMAGAQHMDRWAWANLWDACKRETKAKNKGIDTKSDAFFQKVADRFTEVINETQVVDSIFHRSQMMRSRDNLARMATSFMAEPTRAYNMIYRAAVRGNKGQVATSVVAFAASTALNAAVKGLWDALRKRDEDDEYWEQFREYAIQSFTDDINPLGMVPYVKDVWEIIQGWTTERTDMSPYEDIINASRALLSFYEGKGGKSEYQVWATFTKAASAFTGVPLKGMLTSIEGGINALKPGMLIYRSKRATDNYATLYEYMRDGKTTDAKALRERLQTNVSKGDTPKNRYGQTPQTDRQIDAGIANIMAFGVTDENGKVTIEPDKRIAEAYKMRQNGDIVKLKELREKVKKEGFTEEMFDEAVVKYANAQVEKAEGTKATTLDTQLIKYADMVPAFEKALDGKGLADFEAALEEIMRDSNAKDKDKTMRTQVTTHIKPLYKEAYVAGDTERMKKIRDTLKAAGFEYTDKDFKEWVKEKAGAELFKMIDARESPENIKKEVQRQKDAKHYKNNSAMLKDLNAEYEEKYKDLYFSGLNGNEKDAERARALKKALQDTGLTNYAGDEAFRDDWIAQHWESDEAYAKWLEKPKSRYKVSGTQSE